MPNEFIIKNGFFSQGNSSVTGDLSVSGTITSTSNINLSGFTNGSVLFASGSTGTITGSTNLFWNNSTGRLGIGTSSPSYQLDIVGTEGIRVQDTGFNQITFYQAEKIDTYGNTNYEIITNQAGIDLNSKGSGNIRFLTTGSTRATIFNTTGNIGINTTTDAGYKLDVVGDVRINSTMTLSTSPTFPGLIGFNRNVTTGSILNASYGAYQMNNDEGVFEIQGYNTGGIMQFQHTIFNNGNFILGGSSSPIDTGNRLDVVGNTKLRSATYFGSIAQPSAPTLTSNSTTGGTLSATTYYYKIVAYDFFNNFTTPSNELAVTTAGSTSRISLSWTLVSGAYGYRIYRGTSSNGQNTYYSIAGTNSTTFTDTGAAGTAGTTPTINQTAYGSYNSNGAFRSGNITIVNNGIGNYSSIVFDKSTDSPQINVVEYGSDSTMFEFSLRDNPDGTNDFFHWVFPDWQNPSTGWKPLKFSDLSLQFIGLNTNFWSSFLLPTSTPYFTTNPETLANSSIKFNPYNSNTYNLIKDNGTGTGNLNVEISGYTNSISRMYWVTIQAGNTTFNWGIGSNVNVPIGSNITITGGWQTLDFGVQVRITGSVLAGDRWSFRAFPLPRMGVGTTTPTAPLQVSSTVNASGAIARGVLINNTLNATANNDVLVGLDIQPTFTPGAFTGVAQIGLRVNGSIQSPIIFGATYLALSSGAYTQPISFYLNQTSTLIGRFFGTTGNLLLQNGGTFTDAGYRLDVNGTTRIQNKLSVGTPTESSAIVEITSTNGGLLIPRMTSVQKLAITSPAVGLMVFDTDNGLTEIYDSFWEWMPISNQNAWMRRWGMEYWNDFGANNSFNDGVYTTFATNGGGQGVTTTPLPLSSNSYIGYQGLRTGVNSNGTAQLRTDVNIGGYVFFGNGKFQFESRVFIRTLSTGTDRYNLIVGFSNSTSSTMAAGCTFIYDEGGVGTGTLVSPNWQIMTAFSSVRTVVDTGVAVSASTFYNFRVDINDNSTVVNYYLNDILVRTETTNIPPDGTRVAQPIIGITKTVGTTDIGILVDYIGLKKKFRIPR